MQGIFQDIAALDLCWRMKSEWNDCHIHAWVIDQAWDQDALILAKFFFAFLLNPTSSRSIKRQEKTRPISSHLDQTCLVNKRLIVWPERKIFSCGNNAGNPERARCVRSGSQSERRIRSILPARGFSLIINLLIYKLETTFSDILKKKLFAPVKCLKMCR